MMFIIGIGDTRVMGTDNQLSSGNFICINKPVLVDNLSHEKVFQVFEIYMIPK